MRRSPFIRERAASPRGLEAAAYTAWKAARLVRGRDPAPILARRDAIESNRRVLLCLCSAHNPHLARLARDAAGAHPWCIPYRGEAQIIDIR